MSDFVELDSFSESVLKDIIEHQESSYWKERFSDFPKAKNFWYVFGELKERKYITYKSFDNLPAIIRILPLGETYFKDKEEYLRNKRSEKHKKTMEKVATFVLGIISGVIITVASEIIIRRIFS